VVFFLVDLERAATDPVFDRLLRLRNARAALSVGIPAYAVLEHILDVLIEERKERKERKRK
jgi:hypothetical protein